MTATTKKFRILEIVKEDRHTSFSRIHSNKHKWMDNNSERAKKREFSFILLSRNYAMHRCVLSNKRITNELVMHCDIIIQKLFFSTR